MEYASHVPGTYGTDLRRCLLRLASKRYTGSDMSAHHQGFAEQLCPMVRTLWETVSIPKRQVVEIYASE